MNQFNMNWMFPPPNLFGMRAPNRNGSQFTGQPFSEGMRGEDKDMSENAPHMDTDGSEDISEMPGEKPARRELPGHRVPREPPDRWDREEIPVNVDLPGRPAIHKIISLHLTQGRIW